MISVPPNDQDVRQLAEAAGTFRGAVGSGMTATGSARDTDAQARGIWLCVTVSKPEFERLWQHQGLRMDGPQGEQYAALLEAAERRIKVLAYKFRRGFFRYNWVGNIEAHDGTGLEPCYLGSIRGRTQDDLWREFRNFLALRTYAMRDRARALMET